MMLGVVTGEQVPPEIALAVAPERVDMVCIFLGIVELDQEGRTLQSVVHGTPRFGVSGPGEVDPIPTSLRDAGTLAGGDRCGDVLEIGLQEVVEECLLGRAEFGPRDADRLPARLDSFALSDEETAIPPEGQRRPGTQGRVEREIEGAGEILLASEHLHPGRVLARLGAQKEGRARNPLSDDREVERDVVTVETIPPGRGGRGLSVEGEIVDIPPPDSRQTGEGVAQPTGLPLPREDLVLERPDLLDPAGAYGTERGTQECLEILPRRRAKVFDRDTIEKEGCEAEIESFLVVEGMKDGGLILRGKRSRKGGACTAHLRGHHRHRRRLLAGGRLARIPRQGYENHRGEQE